MLEQVDEETRRIYLQEEYKMFMADYRYKRRNQSLEKSIFNCRGNASGRTEVS